MVSAYGHMRHEDHLGNRGELKSGWVQWMTAGRGIIHSEMPQQEKGRMRGFQLWINLPAAEKLKPASYRDIQPAEIPVVDLPQGGWVKVIAGNVVLGDELTAGPIQGLTTEPLYLDVALPPGERLSLPIHGDHNAFVYPYEGNVRVGEGESASKISSQSAGVLTLGDKIDLFADTEGTRFLVLAGRPLREPIVQYGPFVMNTREEIEQAIADYQSGELVRAA